MLSLFFCLRGGAFQFWLKAILHVSETCLKPHSPLPHAGGVVTAGLAIYDTMQYILNPISTWCVGQAASMGSLLLAAGTTGMRHSLPNARIMVHQVSGGAKVSRSFVTSPESKTEQQSVKPRLLRIQGQATDIAIQAEEILKLKRQLNNIYAKHTGQLLETIGEFLHGHTLPNTLTYINT